MLYPISNIGCKLFNGELIAGYLAIKGIIKEIEKYKGNELLKKYPYLGPNLLFTVPLGEDLFNKIKNNDGYYIAFRKCSLYYENANCHYSQGCRCYCGHCCRCCTCNHNNINDPNLPLGAIGDSLKDKLKKYYNPFGKNESIDPGLYSINGNKGIYDCSFSDPKGYGYKFKINCEQVSFPKDIVPKGGNVDIFEDYDKNEGKKIKPFINLFKTLSNYSKDIKKKTKKQTNKDKDEDYKPSKEELKELNNPDNNFLKKNKKRKVKYIDKKEYRANLEEQQEITNNPNNKFLKPDKKGKAKYIDEIEYKPELEELHRLKNNYLTKKTKRKYIDIDEEYRPSLDEIKEAEKSSNDKMFGIINKIKDFGKTSLKNLESLNKNLGVSRLEEQSKNEIVTMQYFSENYRSIIKERDKSFYNKNNSDFGNFSFVINKYTGQDYKYLNKYLNLGNVGGGFSEKELKSWAYCLHSSLQFRKSNVKDGTVVHRGIQFDPPRDWKVGQRFYFPQFISTSKNEDVAKFFATGGIGSTILHITIKNNGTNGHNNYCRYIADISNFKGEEEVLITAFCRFTIKKIDGNEIYLDCEGY